MSGVIWCTIGVLIVMWAIIGYLIVDDIKRGLRRRRTEEAGATYKNKPQKNFHNPFHRTVHLNCRCTLVDKKGSNEILD